MDWTIGLLDHWTIGLFLDYFLDDFLDNFLEDFFLCVGRFKCVCVFF